MKYSAALVVLFLILGCEENSSNGITEPDKNIALVEINPINATIYKGSTVQFVATVKDQYGEVMSDVEIEWSSSDDSIAIINSQGIAAGLETGTVTISASTDSVSGNATLNVLPLELPSSFPDDFPPQIDHLTGNELGGWGGGVGVINKNLVIFIHGNAHTAGNWIELANTFLDSGYIPTELWALSYLDFNEANDSANSNIANIPDIENFINDVLEYADVEKVIIVSHSLGVTVIRAWMKKNERYSIISHFIGIAGANHGVAFCNNDTISILCRELGHPDSEFLTWLNEPDEIPFEETTKYMTIYDGTGIDFFYPAVAVMNDGSVIDLRNSPVLEGAYNFQNPGVNHFLLPTHSGSVNAILEFLQE